MNWVRQARVITITLFCSVAASSGIALGTTYDFSTNAGVDRFAYGYSIPEAPVPPLGNAAPSAAFYGAQYTAIASSNDVHYSTGSVENGNIAAVRFVFTIAEQGSSVTQIDVLWEGAANEDKQQSVWLWNAASGSYVLIGSQEDVRLSPGGTGDAVVSATIAENAPDFVDANNAVTILVNYGEPGGALFTDYVSLTVPGAPCDVDADCDDGVFCNGAEPCVGGTCQVATPVDCDDTNACTTDSCNEQTDMCDTLPVVCDDGLYCNGAETCDPVLGCQASAPVDCDDANNCTIDSCNEVTDTCDNVPADPLPMAASPDPIDGAIEVVLAPTLGWDGGPPSDPACPRTYDVYLDTSNPPVTLVASGLSNPTYSSAPLAEVTTYYWQIVSRDCCTETAGPVWGFTTLGTPFLSADPVSLDFVLSPDQTDLAQLTLTNNGNAPTTWTAVEAAGQRQGRGGAPDPPPERRPAIDWGVPHEPNTLLVAFKPIRSMKDGRSEIARERVHAACQTTRLHSCRTIPVDVVQVPAGADLQAVAAEYAALPEIDYVEPNYAYSTSLFPNDPSFGSLWGMHNTGQTGGTPDADIDAPEAWDMATGSQNIVVAVIDTGVDYTHPELAGNMWTNDAELNGTPGIDDDGNGIVDDIYGARWTSGTGAPTSGDPYDDHYHGTHVSGTIGAAGNNSLGVVGVNWNVRIMAVKFLNSGGSGWLADAVSAVEYATAQGAHLTSNSWGGGGYSQALKDAIDASGAAGQLFVAAAGNNARNADIYPMYPAAYSSPTIVSVAATDRNDLRAWFSNYGLTSVDLAAPGVSVLSTSPGNSYRTLNGTSMACPHVSGVAALVLSQNPALPPLDLKQIIMDSVDPIPSMAGITVTGGRLNAASALALMDPASWLDFAPTTGVLAPGESVMIAVTADTTGLAPGFVDSVLIRVSSGDPNSPLDVPVGLTVASCTIDADCADGVYCNGAEACVAGTCQPGAPVDCNDFDVCTSDSCNEATGSCDNTFIDCDDGFFCNGLETCDAVLGCQAGTPVNCDDADACTTDTCNEATDMCESVPTVCDDGLFCNGVETCDPVSGCLAGTPVNCDDGVACTIDSCNEATDLCDNAPDDGACDNGSFCDGAETCDPVFDCQMGAPPDCSGMTDQCNDGVCDDVAGACLAEPVPDGTTCDDSVYCNGAETCVAGACQPGAPVDCNDFDACTSDSCNEATDMCESVPTVCDDGLFCNGVETCDPVSGCLAGTPVNCDDGVACTIDSCNEAADSCDNAPDDAACDNGSFCDGAETCDPVFDCQMGAPPDCSGMTDQCNDGVCDDVAGACLAEPVPDGTACDDGDACDGDTCQAGVCVPADCGMPPPAPPRRLKAGFDEKVELEWKPNQEPDLAGYNVYRSMTPGGPYTQIVALLQNKSYKDFPPPGYYCYVVTASNASGGESDYSNEVCGDVGGGG